MKKKTVLFAVLAVVLVGVIALWVISFLRTPLDRYDLSGCRVGVYNADGTDILQYLSGAQAEEFLSILTAAKSSRHGGAIPKMSGGRSRQFRLELSDGTFVDIATMGEYLVIDDTAYPCDPELGGKLDPYWMAVFEAYYPVTPQ